MIVLFLHTFWKMWSICIEVTRRASRAAI